LSVARRRGVKRWKWPRYQAELGNEAYLQGYLIPLRQIFLGRNGIQNPLYLLFEFRQILNLTNVFKPGIYFFCFFKGVESS